MKNILTISALFLGTFGMFAQQTDAEIITTLKNNNYQQRQEIDILKKQIKEHEYAFGTYSKEIKDLNEKNDVQKIQVDSLSLLVQKLKSKKVINAIIKKSLDLFIKTKLTK